LSVPADCNWRRANCEIEQSEFYLIAFGKVCVGKHKKETRFLRVRNPHFGAVQHPLVAWYTTVLDGIRINDDSIRQDTRLVTFVNEHGVTDETRTFLLRSSFESKGIGATAGFRQAEGRQGICCQPREILLLLCFGAKLADTSVD